MAGSPDQLIAPISYLSEKETCPETLIFPRSSGRETIRPKQEEHLVSIQDLRREDEAINLENQGFELIKHQTKIRNLYDNDTVKKYYYPEMAQFLKIHLGAEEVLVFDHNQRSRSRADRGEVGMRYPVSAAHVDYTRNSGAKRARDILADFGKQEYESNHLALINIWRPINGPVIDMPLAICGGVTISTDDLIESPIKHFSENSDEAANHAGTIYSLRYSKLHRWYYVSEMQENEVLLLKNWHSANGSGVFNAPHTGFKNPKASENTKPRESIEIRTLVIYPN